MKKIAIINYGSGNLHSAKKAFQKAAYDISNSEVFVTENPSDLSAATHIVLPGVGAFGDCVSGLKAINGMIKSLEKEVLENKKPFLGICVGMQMLAKKGFEDGEFNGLGWVDGEVRIIKSANENIKIPHMGWNDVAVQNKSKIFDGINSGSDFYFVHSYQMELAEKYISAKCNYGVDITAAVGFDNIYGVQFHPEKSQKNGLKLIKNFIEL